MSAEQMPGAEGLNINIYLIYFRGVKGLIYLINIGQ